MTGVALVEETLGFSLSGRGSFGWMKFSAWLGVEDESERQAAWADRASEGSSLDLLRRDTVMMEEIRREISSWY